MAIAWPIPRVPPVTKAVLPSNENRDAIVKLRTTRQGCIQCCKLSTMSDLKFILYASTSSIE